MNACMMTPASAGLATYPVRLPAVSRARVNTVYRSPSESCPANAAFAYVQGLKPAGTALVQRMAVWLTLKAPAASDHHSPDAAPLDTATQTSETPDGFVPASAAVPESAVIVRTDSVLFEYTGIVAPGWGLVIDADGAKVSKVKPVAAGAA